MSKSEKIFFNADDRGFISRITADYPRYKGFTFIETMITLLIFSIILGAIFTAMAMGRLSWHSGDAQVEVQQETRKGIHWMVRELRESGPGKVIIADDKSSITFQVPVDSDNNGTWQDIDNDGQLEYIWNVTDKDRNIEWGAPLHLSCRYPYCEVEGYSDRYHYVEGVTNDNCHYPNYGIKYLVSGGQLLRKVLDAYPIGSQVREDVLANNIAALQFEGERLLKITLRAEKKTIQGHTIQSSLSSQVKLRN